jgi:hypothetical protein
MKRFLLSASVLAGLGLSSVANANVIQNFTSPNSTQADFNHAGMLILTLPEFNSSLGTLTGATLQIEGISQPQLEVLNLGSATSTGSGTTVATYSVTGPGVSGLSASVSSGLVTVTVPGGIGNIASSPPPSPIFFNPVVALSDLAAVTGPGTVAFDVTESFTTTGTTIAPAGADLAYGGGASANFLMDVTYTYTPGVRDNGGDPVPEPFSITILGVGLLGVGIVKRRRKE